MTTMKKTLCLLLSAMLLLSCVTPAFASDEKRNITIGLWWDRYYDSTHETVDESPSYQGTVSDQMLFEVVDKIEQTYDVTIQYVNMTYTGVRESINTSILAGTPECDIYLVDLAMGIPAAMNGYAIDLKTVLPEDSDIFSDKVIMNYLDLNDGTARLMKPVAAQSQVEATYPLMFNKQMLDDANLEDPRELYTRGEWTWDKFISYCVALTKDTDGNGSPDVYGFGGYQAETFDNLCMSNGTYVAMNDTENFSSAKVGEVLKLMQDMYTVHNCAYPYDDVDPSNTMRVLYRDGKVAFSPGAAWILASNADYDWDGSVGSTLSFDLCFVPWPVGPSGDQETNKQKQSGGEYYMIPVGVEDPELVYNVFHMLTNWYNDDVSIRDDEETLGWWYGVTGRTIEIQDQNFDVMFEAGLREQFDLVNSLNVELDYTQLFNGEFTPAQFQETYKQQFQDALDSYYK